jgi:hypothetical protein
MRIHVMELIEGDTLTEDAFNSYGLHILSEARILNKDDIDKLINHEIDYVEISSSDPEKIRRCFRWD